VPVAAVAASSDTASTVSETRDMGSPGDYDDGKLPRADAARQSNGRRRAKVMRNLSRGGYGASRGAADARV
jgi:hypothetical protein